MEKHFISAEELLADSFELGLQIFESGYRPTFIVGVWRGGTPVGIAIQEVLSLLGCAANHFAIRTSAYSAIDVAEKEVQVLGLQHVVDTINAEDRLLIIDDIFDSGRSIEAIINVLNEKARRNTPSDIRVATVYYKPSRNATARVPDFYLHETDQWVMFPHELEGCTTEELGRKTSLPKRLLSLLRET